MLRKNDSKTSVDSQIDQQLRTMLGKIRERSDCYAHLDKKWKKESDEEKKDTYFKEGLTAVKDMLVLFIYISEFACKSSNLALVKKASLELIGYFDKAIAPIKDNEFVIHPSMFEKIYLSLIRLLSAAGNDIKMFEYIQGYYKDIHKIDMAGENKKSDAQSDSLKESKQRDEKSGKLFIEEQIAKIKESADWLVAIELASREDGIGLSDEYLKEKEGLVYALADNYSAIFDFLRADRAKLDNIEQLAAELADIFDKSIKDCLCVYHLDSPRAQIINQWAEVIYLTLAFVQGYAKNSTLMLKYLEDYKNSGFSLDQLHVHLIVDRYDGHDVEKVLRILSDREAKKSSVLLDGKPVVPGVKSGDAKAAALVLGAKPMDVKASASASASAAGSPDAKAPTSVAKPNDHKSLAIVAGTKFSDYTALTVEQRNEQARLFESRLKNSMNLGCLFVTKHRPNPVSLEASVASSSSLKLPPPK